MLPSGEVRLYFTSVTHCQRAQPAAFSAAACRLFGYGVFEGFAGLEDGGAGGGDGDGLAGGGVAAGALVALLYVEAAEADDGDLAARGELLGDGLEDGVERALGILLERPDFSAAAAMSSVLFIC